MAVWICLALVLEAIAVVVASVALSPQVSPYDEATHADYVYRVSHFQLPARGDLLSQQIVGEWACRGGYTTAIPLPACGLPSYDVKTFPNGGQQYNFGHPPVYYLVTAVPTRVMHAAFGLGYITAGRLVGIAWLAGGLLAVLLLLRKLSVPWEVAGPAAGLIGLLPTIVHASSTVNNDAAGVLCGAGAILVALYIREQRASWPSAFLVAAAVAGTKVIFVGALAPAAVVLLFAARDRQLRRRCLSSVVAMVAGSGLVTGGWMVLQGHRGDPSWVNPLLGQNTQLAHGFPLQTTFVNLLAEWPPTTNPFLQRGLTEAQMSLWITVTNLLLASGIVAVLLRGRGTALWLSIGTAVGLLSIPVLVELFSYYGSDHYYFPRVSSRYAICLLPGMVLGLAVTLRGSRARWVAGALVAAGALVLATSLGGPTST